MLRDASKYGKVIVALNSDDWVLKNKGHLLFDFETRKSLLEECTHVSKVISFDDSEGDATYALFEIKPTYFGNGGSATSLSLPKEELQVCGYLGIETIFDLGNVSKEIENLKTFRPRAATIFMVVQAGMGLAIAWIMEMF